MPVFLFLVACHPRKSSPSKNDLSSLWSSGQTDKFITGVVINPVFIKGDSSLSYALYLPKTYSDSIKWPVIYFFDPHAAGDLPVKKYAYQAEQFGTILIGSNNIKNRMSGDELNRFLRQLFDDTYRRFSIDEKRTCVAGFSGGARVATSLALSDPAIRGVIACGGGFPSTSQIPPVHFDFLGFAGNEDFNLPELLQLDSFLKTQSCRHFLIRFKGKHEWPDSLTFRDAFLWNTFNAMKDNLIPVNDSLIQSFQKETMYEYQRMSDAHIIEKADLLSGLITFLDGLTDTKAYEIKLQKLYTDLSYKTRQQQFASLIKEESRMEQSYIQAFTSRPLLWWKEKINKLNTEIRRNSGEKRSSYQRILHYLSLVAYMQADASLRQQQNESASKYITIYRLVDPGNAYVYYFSAILEARRGNKANTMKSLKKAIQLGFDDYKDLMTRTEFSSLRDTPWFVALVKK